MFLFNSGNDTQRYSPAISVQDGKEPEGSFVYPGPQIRNLPYFSNNEPNNEPKPARYRITGTEDNLVYESIGKHYSAVDRYGQQGELHSSGAWGNAPYWRYTGWYRNPPKFMQVDASDSRLLNMSVFIDAGPSSGFTIGSVNSGKLLFQRFDGESYSNENDEPFGGSDNSDVAMWVRYRPVYNITKRQTLNFSQSGMTLRFSYFFQTDYLNTGPTGDYAPPCWNIKIENEFNTDWYPMIFVPASRYDVVDGSTVELRKWYSTNKPTTFDPNFPIDWAINGTACPPQVGPIFGFAGGLTRNGESHGHQSPYQETEYVFANVALEGRLPAYIQHTPTTARNFPKIKVSPITL